MKITETLQNAYQSFPETSSVTKSVLVMATAAIAIEALSNIPGAEAGPITYAACVSACGVVFPPLVPVCLASCLPLLAAPTP